MTEDNAKYDIEYLINEVGLAQFMEHVCQICHEKADHVRANWSDPILSKLWKKQGKIREKYAWPLEL